MQVATTERRLTIFLYDERYHSEYLLLQLWEELKTDNIIDIIFHKEIESFNEFIRFMSDSLVFIGTIDNRLVGTIWLYSICKHRALIGLYLKRSYIRLALDEADNVFDYIFRITGLKLLIGYSSNPAIVKIAERVGFRNTGIIDNYFADGENAYVLTLERS